MAGGEDSLDELRFFEKKKDINKKSSRTKYSDLKNKVSEAENEEGSDEDSNAHYTKSEMSKPSEVFNPALNFMKKRKREEEKILNDLEVKDLSNSSIKSSGKNKK